MKNTANEGRLERREQETQIEETKGVRKRRHKKERETTIR